MEPVKTSGLNQVLIVWYQESVNYPIWQENQSVQINCENTSTNVSCSGQQKVSLCNTLVGTIATGPQILEQGYMQSFLLALPRSTIKAIDQHDPFLWWIFQPWCWHHLDWKQSYENKNYTPAIQTRRRVRQRVVQCEIECTQAVALMAPEQEALYNLLWYKTSEKRLQRNSNQNKPKI